MNMSESVLIDGCSFDHLSNRRVVGLRKAPASVLKRLNKVNLPMRETWTAIFINACNFGQLAPIYATTEGEARSQCKRFGWDAEIIES